jgi:2,5-furandicarboxylate decarboxylase 1
MGRIDSERRSKMERQMLRATIDKLNQIGKLLVTDKEVDPIYELGAVLKHYENSMPMLFKRVKGHKMPVIGGLYGNREIYYHLLGVTRENRIHRIMNAIANPMPAKLLNNGPVKENIITSNIDMARYFPNPKFSEKDGGAFITSGLMVVKDPETGKRYTSVRRFQINGGNQISALITSKTKDFFLELEKQNKPLEVAVVLGYDAYTLTASQISMDRYGLDKYEVDSALRGEPLELVKCHTVDLEVPAYAEMVFEGVIVPNKRQVEGPFGELMGYYGPAKEEPVMEVKCIMHRNNPIYQTAGPSREEHFSNGIIREVELYYTLKNMVDVQDVNVTIGGGCRFHVIASINKKTEGDPKTAIIGALASEKNVKHAVIVDNDVNIFDPMDVEFALASRVQASKDVVIIPGATGSGLEASYVYYGVTDKMGIDATKPLSDPKELFERAIIPGYENGVDINKYFPGINK